MRRYTWVSDWRGRPTPTKRWSPISAGTSASHSRCSTTLKIGRRTAITSWLPARTCSRAGRHCYLRLDWKGSPEPIGRSCSRSFTEAKRVSTVRPPPPWRASADSSRRRRSSTRPTSWSRSTVRGPRRWQTPSNRPSCASCFTTWSTRCWNVRCRRPCQSPLPRFPCRLWQAKPQPSNTMPQGGPDLETLLALFPPSTYIRSAEPIAADQMPEPYRRLLVHEHHMTVTVEAHHGDLVNVRVLERRIDNGTYARKILLTLQKTGKVVQFG